MAINPKNREIRDKMSNILAKWLHYLWFFPNIRDILIKLLHLLGDFSENSGTLIVIHTFANANLKNLLALATINAHNVYNASKNATLFFFYPLLHKCNYNMMSFLGHPVCRLGLNWYILLGLFIVFQQ